jgi:hypothetical protein
VPDPNVTGYRIKAFSKDYGNEEKERIALATLLPEAMQRRTSLHQLLPIPGFLLS